MKNFKEWVESHNPSIDWDFSDKDKLIEQFIANIKETGNLDLQTVYDHMFANDDSGLSVEQDEMWITTL